MELLNIINNFYSKIDIYYGIIVCYDNKLVENIYNLLLKDNYPVYKFKKNDNFEDLKFNYRLFIIYQKDIVSFDTFNNITIYFNVKRNLLHIMSNKDITHINKQIKKYTINDTYFYKTDYYINI